MNVAIRYKGERHLLQLPDSATVEELQQHVHQATQLAPSQQLLRWGFPPQPIPTEGKQLSLKEIGCTNGQLILVEVSKPGAQLPSSTSSISKHNAEAQESPAVSTSPKSLPQQQQHQGLEHQQQQQQQEGPIMSDDSDLDEETLVALNAAAAAAARAPRPPISTPPPSGYEFVRVPVPADDSCLFASVALVAVPSVTSQQLRDVAAAGILRDPERFNEVVLELPPPAYVKRLRSARTWGGYLELAVLAEELKHQLAVIDAESGRMDLYGEEFNERRSYLLYDGIHYDPLVAYPPGWRGGTGQAMPQADEMLTVFAADDAAAAAAAAAFGRVVHQQRGFVRAAGMDARCLVCGELLKDNEDLRRHAKATGHQNFAHIQH